MNVQDLSENTILALESREAFDAALEVKRIIFRELEEVAQVTKIYGFKHRLKLPNSIYKKVIRKRAEAARLEDLDVDIDKDAQSDREKKIDKYKNYSAASITDVFACRYVTLFQKQIPEIVTALFDSIHRFNQQSTPHIRLVELVTYTSRPDEHFLSIAKPVINAYQKSNFSSSPEAKGAVIIRSKSKRNAYTSVHATFTLAFVLDLPGKGPVPCHSFFEVQIRDIFEEGWGEIDHHIQYSRKDAIGDASEGDDGGGDAGSKHQGALDILKEAAGTCCAAADSVHSVDKSNKHPFVQTIATKSATSRAEDCDAIVSVLSDAHYSKAAKAIRVAYKELFAAEEADSREVATRKYQSSAVLFDNAISSYSEAFDTELPRHHGRTIAYFVKMELANCLVFGELEERYSDARKTFEEMTEQFPNDPVAKLRLSHFHLKTSGDNLPLDETKTLMEAAISNLEVDKFTKDRPWLAVIMHNHLGYIYWKISLQAKKETERRKRLIDAADSAGTSFDFWQKSKPMEEDKALLAQYAQRAASNRLWYISELLDSGYRGKRYTIAKLRRLVSEYLTLNVQPYWESFKADDNLIRAYQTLNEQKAATKIAERVFSHIKENAAARAGEELKFSDIRHFLHPDEFEPFRRATNQLVEV